jgi:8-oxo-dGTP diphosphatase
MSEILVARAIIVNERNEVLLGERAEGTAVGFMELPGGTVEDGEEPIAAVVREVKEELGLDFTPQGLFRVDAEKGHGDILWKNSYFYGTVKGEMQLNHEVRSARFFSKEEIVFEMAFNHKIHLLEFLDERKKK